MALAAIALTPVAAGGWALRRRLLPEWTGAPARLIEAVLALSQVVIVAEVLGVLSLYRVTPMVVALALTGAVAWRWGRAGVTAPTPTAGTAAPVQLGRWPALATTAAVALVAAPWGARTVDALRHGMSAPDTSWYHMPIAARFVQTSSIRSVHYIDSEPIYAFYPANSPLLHGVGILLFGSDLVSPFINLAWMALALLGGWCVGRPYGVAPVTLAGTALILATPGFVGYQPGNAYTDVVALAPMLAAVAIVMQAHHGAGPVPRAAVCVGGLAAGLALGTKFTMLGPVAALTVAVVFLARGGERVRQAAYWIGGMAATGGLWYVRNLVITGNPLASIALHVGPLSLPHVRTIGHSSTVAHHLLDRSAWGDHLVPGVRYSLGPGWWALLGLALLGLAASTAVGPTRLLRAFGLVGVASLTMYVATPQFLGPDEPVFFGFNFRYASPGLIIGLVLLPILPFVTRRACSRWLLGAYLALLVATQFDAAIWPLDVFHKGLVGPVRGVDAVGGALAGLVVVVAGACLTLRPPSCGRAQPWRARRVVALGTATILVIVGGAVTQRVYLDRRYRTDLSAWARPLHDARIGVVGPLASRQYPLYGKNLSNHVQYVGTRLPRGDFERAADCPSWRHAVNLGRYDYLLLGEDDEIRWTDTDPNVRRVPVKSLRFVSRLYRIDGSLDERCPDVAS